MPPGLASNPWLWLIGLLITSGFLQYAVGAVGAYAKRRRERPKSLPGQPLVDQSLLAMSKATAQLEEDNERLRATNRELSDTLSAERSERTAERAALMREIEGLQAKLREMSYEVAELARKVGQRQKGDTDPSMRTIGPGESRNRPFNPGDHATRAEHHTSPGRAEKTNEIRED